MSHSIQAQDMAGKSLYTVVGGACQCGICCSALPCEACQTVHFNIQNDGGENIGTLDKKTKGCFKSAIGSADNFTCDFPPAAT